MTQQTEQLHRLLYVHLHQIQSKCDLIRRENPTWQQNDIRMQVFERLWYITASVMGLTIAIADSFTQGRWWSDRAGLGMSEPQGRNVVEVSQTFVTLGWVVLSFSIVETTLRTLYEALERKPPPMNVSKVYDAVTRRTGVTLTTDQAAAFQLFRWTRNSMHNNSIHSGPDIDVEFAGYKYEFRPGHRVEYAEYPILINMMEHVQDLMIAVVSTAPTQGLPSTIADPTTAPGITPIPMP